MLKNIQRELGDHNFSVVEGKVRVAASVVSVPKTSQLETKTEKDVKGNEILYVKYKDEWHEVMGEKKNKEGYFVKVDRDDEPKAFPMSRPYFILPPELEAIYGKRAKSIKIMLTGNSLVDVIPVDNMKFDSGKLSCKGDGEKAKRYNKVTEEWEEVDCVCAYHKYYMEKTGDEVENTVKYSNLPESHKRTINKRVKTEKPGGGYEWKPKDVKQVLVQGAWRDVTGYSEAEDMLTLDKLDPSCEGRYTLKFICPEAPTMVHFALDGGAGKEEKNWKRIAAMLSSVEAIFGRMSKVPLDLKVKMKEGTITGKKVNYPVIYIDLPFPVNNLMEKNIREEIQQLPPAQTHALAENSTVAAEDVEYETAEEEHEEEKQPEPVDMDKLWEKYEGLIASIDKDNPGKTARLIYDAKRSFPKKETVTTEELLDIVKFLEDQLLPF